MGRALVLATLALAAAIASFGDLHYRWIGPAVMGGRLDAVAGIAGNPKIVYLAHSSGGLWKSADGGLTFTSVLDVSKSQAIGAVAVDPRDASNIYAGTGEAFPRNTAVAGNGLWHSRDGGKHWRHLGLRDSGAIARIAISPRDSRIVLVAALGREFVPSTQRGIYRSIDGGAHFTRVLYVNATTGGSDVAFDPRDPRIVYAGTYDFLRRPWTLRSGGPGSGLWRSRNGGRTWQRLTSGALRNGLPRGPIGRVGVAVCASDPAVVYAFVPSRAGLLYRSLDGGRTWRMRNADPKLDFRSFYFSQVRCDPRQPKRVYAISGGLFVSNDGGAHFKDAGGGGDNHDLWIDPREPRRLLDASDMGFHYSLDGGATWDYDDVVPFDQVYRVGYDFAFPYHVMGGMQDHEVWWGPSTDWNQNDGISNGDWLDISDWGDGQYAMADPRDPDIVYEDTHFGDLVRANLRTGERRYISPQPEITFGAPASAYRYRFNWSAPLLISHFDPNTLYFGGNVLFRSNDQGESWSAISPDLTHCRASQLGSSGGPIANDETNAETYCTIYTIGEDARYPGTLWIGTDNGHLAITRDGGSTWRDVIASVPGLPLPARVDAISPSPTRPGVAYAAFDRHQSGDPRSYAYVTRDYGKTWTSIARGLEGFVHVVREDPRNANVLYAGTESGVYVSLDGGRDWRDFRLGLPHVPVFDLQIQPRDNDLILGTHGRGFYILDDLAPVQGLRAAMATSLYVFPPPVAYRYGNAMPYHEHGRGAFVAENRPYGALISFYLEHAPPVRGKKKPQVSIEILDAKGALVDRFNSRAHAGINRTAWDLRMLPPSGTHTVQDPRPYYVFYPLTIRGPQVLPGSYTVRIAALGTSMSQPLVVRMDPNHPVNDDGLHAQQSAVLALDAAQERAEVAVRRLNQALKATDSKATAAALRAALDTLRNPDASGYRQPARPIEQLAYLRETIEAYDGPPTQAQRALMTQEIAASDAAVKRAGAVLAGLGTAAR